MGGREDAVHQEDGLAAPPVRQQGEALLEEASQVGRLVLSTAEDVHREVSQQLVVVEQGVEIRSALTARRPQSTGSRVILLEYEHGGLSLQLEG